MQAYQSAPCPYCGATWNPPGAQTCTNCRNQLPPPPPAYSPPGYAPQQGQPGQPGNGNQGQPGYQYGSQYPQQQYPQAPGQYPGAPAGYPGQQGGYPAPGQGQYPGQQGQQYPGYGQEQYGSAPGYPGSPYGVQPGYPGYGAPAAASSTTLRLFGQSLTVPVVLPPIVVQYQQTIAYALLGLIGLLIVFLGVLPAVASGQISSANQAIATAVSHQAKVDGGFSAFFAPETNSADLNVIQAAQSKTLSAISAALAPVQADESALNSADQRLAILSVVAFPSGKAIAAERQKIKTALDGLRQADTALTAGSNLGKVLLSVGQAKMDYARMSNALNKHDLVGAAAPYPDAQQKLQDAIPQSSAPGVPSVIGKEVAALNTLLDDTESLIQAIQNKDAAGTKKSSDAVQADLKTVGALSLPADYEVKTYTANQKAYDAAIKALKS